MGYKNFQRRSRWTPFIQHNWGPFVLEFRVDNDLIEALLKEGNKSRENNLDARKQLAGEIKEEFYYKDYEWFLSAFSNYISSYLECTGGNDKNAWRLDSLWINYQKANEYNPPHNHTGDLSFVIYLQVPKEIELENEEKENERNNAGPGMILFDYGQEMPLSIHRIIHMPRTGDAFIFPAWLVHHVYAFKSDVERISVSGNIFLK